MAAEKYLVRPGRVFPYWGGGRLGGIAPTTRKIGLSPPCPPPQCFTQKCGLCNFHAVFGHFAQIVPPPVDRIWETLPGKNVFLNL